jgi:putative hydrolase of the HAD superfamily
MKSTAFMHKKAIILDLDNTIYSVTSIGEELFAPLLKLIEQEEKHKDEMDKIKDELMRRPFQLVAKKYGFSDELTQRGMDLLKNTTYLGKILPYADYHIVKDLTLDKYLVTTGFLQLQQSKITGMKLSNDFKEIYIVDPYSSDRTKKEVFAEIIARHGYDKSEVLVIGDDPLSEIKAAQELGIDAILYDKENRHNHSSVKKINDYRELKDLIR